MNKELSLRILMLLSALESWSFSTGKMMPDFTHDELREIVNLLTDDVLGTDGKPQIIYGTYKPEHMEAT